VVLSVFLFLLAGICEILGGWMVWQWLRDGRPRWWGLLGAALLASYGMVPTLQPTHFSRAYAAYGGFFIALSLAWGWIVDGKVPDQWDALGALIAIAGVCVIMYAPRPLSGH
jgi:small multidrug resistance family-3 protein